jgi:hypothetical protein
MMKTCAGQRKANTVQLEALTSLDENQLEI